MQSKTKEGVMLEFDNCEGCKNIEIFKPFVVKSYELLKDELKIEVDTVHIDRLEKSIDINKINFISTLTGDIESNVIFSLDRALAKAILDGFPYIKYSPQEEEEMLFEIVAEFLNIVIGNALKEFNNKLYFSTPTEISGENKFICRKSFDVCRIRILSKEREMMIIFSTKLQKER